MNILHTSEGEDQ